MCDFYYKLNFTILACEMSATVWQLEHSLAWPLRDWNENWPFPDLWPLLSFPNLLAYLGITFTAPSFQFIQFSQSVVTDSLRPHEPQHTRPPCPSPTPRVYPNPCPWSRWCHPTISSSVVSFSSCPQSFPASGSFLMSQLFTSGGQSIGVSASTSVLRWTPRTDLL